MAWLRSIFWLVAAAGYASTGFRIVPTLSDPIDQFAVGLACGCAASWMIENAFPFLRGES